MVADAGQGCGGIGPGQQVVEEDSAVAGPGQMFGEGLRLVAVEQPGQAIQMFFVKGGLAADGQTHAMNRQAVVLANPTQVVVEGAAIHHVILGMNLEKTDVRRGRQDFPEVLRLETYPAPAGQPGGGVCVGKHGLEHHGDVNCRRDGAGSGDQAFFSLNAASCPLPVGEVGEAVFSQVPLGTRVQALPW